MTKPAPDFNFPKIVTVIEDYWVPRKGPFPDFYPKICIKRAKSRFLAVTPIFVRLSLIMLQKLTFFHFQNMPLPKIGPNRRILAKNPIFCFGNPIFVDRALVALCVTTILPVGPITISLRFRNSVVWARESARCQDQGKNPTLCSPRSFIFQIPYFVQFPLQKLIQFLQGGNFYHIL